jgi:hypothetical protein
VPEGHVLDHDRVLVRGVLGVLPRALLDRGDARTDRLDHHRRPHPPLPAEESHSVVVHRRSASRSLRLEPLQRLGPAHPSLPQPVLTPPALPAAAPRWNSDRPPLPRCSVATRSRRAIHRYPASSRGTGSPPGLPWRRVSEGVGRDRDGRDDDVRSCSRSVRRRHEAHRLTSDGAIDARQRAMGCAMVKRVMIARDDCAITSAR